MTPEEFANAANQLHPEAGPIVSRETLERLLEMDRVLMDWSSRHNLIARSTIDERWRRHYLDSLQLVPLLPASFKSLADLGSGAGFPGLILAALLEDRQVSVTLIESVGKKAAFLNAAGEAMGLSNLKVIPARIESLKLDPAPEIITARALANLSKLLGYGYGIQGQNTKYFLLKGQDVGFELTEAAKSWQMEVIRHPSATHSEATILEIGNLERVSEPPANHRRRKPERRRR